jgi:hypothetical protein
MVWLCLSSESSKHNVFLRDKMVLMNVLGVWHNVYYVGVEALWSLRNVSIRKFYPDAPIVRFPRPKPNSLYLVKDMKFQQKIIEKVLWLKFQLHGDARTVAQELPAREMYTCLIIVLP